MGPVWQDGYYAHRITSPADFTSQMEYIAHNPKRKGLQNYPFVYTLYTDRIDPPPAFAEPYRPNPSPL